MYLIWKNHEEEVWDSVNHTTHNIRITDMSHLTVVLRAENEAMALRTSVSSLPLDALPMEAHKPPFPFVKSPLNLLQTL